MCQFGGAVAGQTHHRDRARAQQPEQRDRELAAVRQLQQHPVARRDAQIAKPGCGGIGLLVEFGVGQAGPVIGDGTAVGRASVRGDSVRIASSVRPAQ